MEAPANDHPTGLETAGNEHVSRHNRSFLGAVDPRTLKGIKFTPPDHTKVIKNLEQQSLT